MSFVGGLSRASVERAIAEQRAWIERCGGSRAGYVAAYARVDVTRADALAVYEADQDYLRLLLARREFFTEGSR